MSSRVSIQQIVSTSAPAGAALGDEWLNPTTGILYKRTLINGIVDWLSLSSGYSGSAGPTGPSGGPGGAGGVGFTGSFGAFAAIGFTGSQGEQGYWGSFGYTGSLGYIGSRGLVGYVGSKGEPGVGGITTVTNYTAVTNIVGTTSTYNLIPGYTNNDYTGAINDTYTTDNGDLYAWKGAGTGGWVKVGNIKGAVYTLVAQVFTPGSLFTGFSSLYTSKWFPSRSISIQSISARVLSSGTQAVSLNINVDDVTVSTISFTGLGPAYGSNTPIAVESSLSNITVIVTNTGLYASDLYVSIKYINVF